MTAKTTATTTTTAGSKREPRRANKPLMEKRRRARINQSLAQLKALILDTAKADNTKHSKLEKADILELTVRHFQRHRSLDAENVKKYRAGYADCVREVQRYLETPDAHTMTVLDAGIRQRLLRHLDSCIAEIDSEPGERHEADSSTIVVEEVNNNASAAAAMAAAAASAQSSAAQSTASSGPGPAGAASAAADGNLVFVLPTHYLQLAAALGINLQTPTSSDAAAAAAAAAAVIVGDKAVAAAGIDKPMDFSKNNELSEMWRPW